MNYLNKYGKFKISKICRKYGIRNYTINKDGTIDVDGGVNLNAKNLKEFPLNFGRVSGHFYCSRNSLTTLEGGPREVGGHFYCRNNSLTTLEGGPSKVGGGFYCHNNSLTTLEGGPKEVGGDFYCRNNSLTTLEGGPREVGGHFYCRNNPLPQEIYDNYEHIKKIVKYQDDYSIWNRNGSLNHYRFEEMMKEIKEEES